MKKSWYIILGLSTVILLVVWVVAGFSVSQKPYMPYPLPDNPEDWVCRDAEPTEAQIDELCNNPRGISANIGTPPSLFDLNAKNAFDAKFKKFLNDKVYQDKGWLHDKTWRLSGPIAYNADTTMGDGIKSYGVHPAVRIYYSPEAIDWLCDGRQPGKIPDGAMIIKEMVSITKEKVNADSEKCVTLDKEIAEADFNASPQWTVMLKNNQASSDGWYFAYYGDMKYKGNPPIVDRSAFIKKGQDPRDPNLIPTGNNSVVYPNAIYGVTGCMNCHASAAVESTFITLDNILTDGWRYKWYLQDEPSPKYNYKHPKDSKYPTYPKPLKKPDNDFLNAYQELKAIKFSQAWELRLPAETFDHNVAKANGKQEFLTSDQCFGCHDASLSNDWLPNMMLQDEGGYRTNLSMYGEWKSSPMGLAGRDPIFFSQLQSETNNLPDSLTTCVENTCLKCHGVLGQRQFSRDTQGTSDAAKQCNETIYPVQPSGELPTGELYSLKYVTQYQDSKNAKFAKYGALSRDGISCMSCHQMLPNPTTGDYGDVSNEKYFTGNFLTTRESLIFGPFLDKDTLTKPMEHAIDLKPTYGEQVKSSQLCGNCHNIILPVVDGKGNVYNGTKGLPNKAGFEQSTELEWQNSIYGKEGSGSFQTCQGCHMPHDYDGEKLDFKIANFQSAGFPPTTESLPLKDIDIQKVNPYARHSLHGLNVFLNQMFQQFPLILGFRQIDYETTKYVEPSLITNQYSMNDMAQHQTASATVKSIQVTEKGNTSTLTTTVEITNQTGHYFPSGVGFRRAFVEFLVVAKDGSTLWASGRTNRLGQLLDGLTENVLPGENPVANPTVWQPAYETINSGNQVQIYQEVILDENGDVTTSFIRRFHHEKDNRIRPKGYDPQFFLNNPSPYVQQLGELHGSVKVDPYYYDPNLTGADQVVYEVALTPEQMKQVDHVQVTVYYQSIPPGYLQERFRDAGRGPSNEIERLFYLTSHMNVETPTDRYGQPYMKDWKLQISRTVQKK